jgi:hypothetical protein
VLGTGALGKGLEERVAFHPHLMEPHVEVMGAEVVAGPRGTRASTNERGANKIRRPKGAEAFNP